MTANKSMVEASFGAPCSGVEVPSRAVTYETTAACKLKDIKNQNSLASGVQLLVKIDTQNAVYGS